MWQPIETAPKEGDSIIVAAPTGAVWCHVHWQKMNRVPDRWSAIGLGPLPFRPTHWMPMPPPPTASGLSATALGQVTLTEAELDKLLSEAFGDGYAMALEDQFEESKEKTS